MVLKIKALNIGAKKYAKWQIFVQGKKKLAKGRITDKIANVVTYNGETFNNSMHVNDLKFRQYYTDPTVQLNRKPRRVLEEAGLLPPKPPRYGFRTVPVQTRLARECKYELHNYTKSQLYFRFRHLVKRIPDYIEQLLHNYGVKHMYTQMHSLKYSFDPKDKLDITEYQAKLAKLAKLKDANIEEYEGLLSDYKIKAVKLVQDEERLEFINRMVMNYDPKGTNLLDLIDFNNQVDITPKQASQYFNVPPELFETWYKSSIPKNEEYFEFYEVDNNYMTNFDKEIEEFIYDLRYLVTTKNYKDIIFDYLLEDNKRTDLVEKIKYKLSLDTSRDLKSKKMIYGKQFRAFSLQDAIDQTYDASSERENWTPKEQMEREEYFLFTLHPHERVSQKPDVHAILTHERHKQVGRQRDRRRGVRPAYDLSKYHTNLKIDADYVDKWPIRRRRNILRYKRRRGLDLKPKLKNVFHGNKFAG